MKDMGALGGVESVVNMISDCLPFQRTPPIIARNFPIHNDYDVGAEHVQNSRKGIEVLLGCFLKSPPCLKIGLFVFRGDFPSLHGVGIGPDKIVKNPVVSSFF